MTRAVYFLGGYQTDFSRVWSREGRDLSDMIEEATRGALAESHLRASAIETVHVGNAMGELYRGQGHLGPLVAQVVPELRGLPASRHEGACASGSLAILAAAAEIEAGRYDCALVVGVEEEKNVPGESAARIQDSASWLAREDLDCRFLWPAVFGRIAKEYEARQGLDRRHLSRIAEINYGNARANPKAQTRSWHLKDGAFNEDDDLNPEIEPGIRRMDCTHITDGACALVLASEAFAADHAPANGLRFGLLRAPARLGTSRRWDQVPRQARARVQRGLPHASCARCDHRRLAARQDRIARSRWCGDPRLLHHHRISSARPLRPGAARPGLDRCGRRLD